MDIAEQMRLTAILPKKKKNAWLVSVPVKSTRSTRMDMKRSITRRESITKKKSITRDSHPGHARVAITRTKTMVIATAVARRESLAQSVALGDRLVAELLPRTK